MVKNATAVYKLVFLGRKTKSFLRIFNWIGRGGKNNETCETLWIVNMCIFFIMYVYIAWMRFLCYIDTRELWRDMMPCDVRTEKRMCIFWGTLHLLHVYFSEATNQFLLFRKISFSSFFYPAARVHSYVRLTGKSAENSVNTNEPSSNNVLTQWKK